MSLSAADKTSINTLTSTTLRDQVTVSVGWENYMGTAHQNDAIVINVNSSKALIKILHEITKLNEVKNADERIIVRAAAASSYSATNCVNADVILRLTGTEFHHIAKPENFIVTAGASVQIGDLCRILNDEHHLTLSTASLIPDVTIAGLAAAGGHGTGQDQPSFAGLVRGMTLCLETGEIVHIDQSHKHFATIAGANNGLFGIVLDMDIECIPEMKLQCIMEKRSPIEFMEDVERGLFQNNEYVSVMYIPTYLPDEMTNRKINNVIVYRWKPVPCETNNTNYHPVFSSLIQDIQGKLGKAVNIPEILRTFPKLIPLYMRYLTRPLTVGETDKIAVGPWHGIWHNRTDFPADLDEICGMIPVKDQARRTKQGEEIVTAMKRAMTLLGEHAKKGEYPITYAMYFRYLQGTNGGLSITGHQDDHHVCAIDLTTNERIPGFAAYKKEMQDFFLSKEMQGKLHWGKNAPMDVDYHKMYGDRWLETKAALEDWHHEFNIDTKKSMLLNPLFSEVLDYPVPSLVDTDVPAKVQTDKEKRKLVANANKLLCMIDDNSSECQCARKEIAAAQQKLGRNRLCIFSRSSAKETGQEQGASCFPCSIL